MINLEDLEDLDAEARYIQAELKRITELRRQHRKTVIEKMTDSPMKKLIEILELTSTREDE